MKVLYCITDVSVLYCSGGRGRRGRPRLGDFTDKHGAGERYPEVQIFALILSKD